MFIEENNLPHNSAYVSIAEDGNVAIIGGDMNLKFEVEILVEFEDDHLVLRQLGRRHLDVDLPPAVVDAVRNAPMIVVIESLDGDGGLDDGEHVVHRVVRKAFA